MPVFARKKNPVRSDCHMSYDSMNIRFFISGLLFLLLPLLVLWLFPANAKVFPQFGENDFIEYWATYQLHSRGADPYHPALIAAVERAQGWPEAQPLMMWNPPWALVILSPVLS